MRLLVSCEVFLTLHVKVNHSFCELISMSSNRWIPFQHGSIECSINLSKRMSTWEINQNQRTMSKESIA
jgi:hypothetical protein